jgi:tetratricopeptide (TPR) repeat protein
LIFAELGDFESAEEALRAALLAAERIGLTDLTTVALQNLGHVLAHRGHLNEARLLEQRAADAFVQLGDQRLEGVARRYLAEIALLAGDLPAAEREARAAVEMSNSAPSLQAVAGATLARVLLAGGHADAALAAAGHAMGTLERLGQLDEDEVLVRLTYAKALAASGKHQESKLAAAGAKNALLARAAKISDPAWRERFLSAVPANADTRALGAAVQMH